MPNIDLKQFRSLIRAPWGGGLILFFVVMMMVISLFALFYTAFQGETLTFEWDDYLIWVIEFTFLQALLSTVLSLILALLLAKAFMAISFWGKSTFLRLLSMIFVLPSLVVVTGLLTIYGHQGWISNLFHYWDRPYLFSLYGLTGILMAHLFFNFPFATRWFYQTLQQIPNEQRQLADQLGLTSWKRFCYLEWPLLWRQMGSLSGLIFMICFSSFAIVLALGGGPKYTTLEVAIYQSIRDFELLQAGVLGIIQMAICLCLMGVILSIQPKTTPLLNPSRRQYRSRLTQTERGLSLFLIVISALFILLPLFGILDAGIRSYSFDFLTPSLFKALGTSIAIALSSALLTLLFTVLILSSYTWLHLHHSPRWGDLLLLVGSAILAVPSLLFSAGLFILYTLFWNDSLFVPLLIVISNSFLALPFLLKLLAPATLDLAQRYQFLAQSLNLRGIFYFYWVEFKGLTSLFRYSLAFAAVLSLGDFGIIAFFGNRDMMTLPYYLYELLSHYRQEEAAFVAMILLILSFMILWLLDRSPSEMQQ